MRTGSFALRLFACCGLACGTLAGAAEPKNRAVYVAELDADRATVWTAFTTSKGLRTWIAPIAEIELKIGGKMRTNYNAKGTLKDDTAIENTILAFDPQRMLALKATRFPKNFPFTEAGEKTWSVFYFEKLSERRTRVTVVGLGYTDDPNSRQLRQFFAGANKFVLDKLNGVLKAKSSRDPKPPSPGK